MKRLKILIRLLLILMVIAALIYGVVVTHRHVIEQQCIKINVEIDTTGGAHFVTEKEVRNLVEHSFYNPLNQPLDSVNMSGLEQDIARSLMVKKVAVYASPRGILTIRIKQKRPVFRVMTFNDQYYVDDERYRMTVSRHYVVRLPIVTGEVHEGFAKGALFDFMCFIAQDSFYSALIQQVDIRQGNRVVLVPNVGQAQIEMGSLDRYEAKLGKLKTYYEKVVPKVGWNAYRTINLEYKDQVVCTIK